MDQLPTALEDIIYQYKHQLEFRAVMEELIENIKYECDSCGTTLTNKKRSCISYYMNADRTYFTYDEENDVETILKEFSCDLSIQVMELYCSGEEIKDIDIKNHVNGSKIIDRTISDRPKPYNLPRKSFKCDFSNIEKLLKQVEERDRNKK